MGTLRSFGSVRRRTDTESTLRRDRARSGRLAFQDRLDTDPDYRAHNRAYYTMSPGATTVMPKVTAPAL